MRSAFVESEVEIQVWDDYASQLDDHGMKLWIHRAFRELSCYQIREFARDLDQNVRVTVALKTSHLSASDQAQLVENPKDSYTLQSFVQTMFSGDGSCRCLGIPRITYF